MAQWRVMPTLRFEEGILPQESPHLEMHGLPETVLREGWYNYGGQPNPVGEVARIDLACNELQQRHQFL